MLSGTQLGWARARTLVAGANMHAPGSSRTYCSLGNWLKTTVTGNTNLHTLNVETKEVSSNMQGGKVRLNTTHIYTLDHFGQRGICSILRKSTRLFDFTFLKYFWFLMQHFP